MTLSTHQMTEGIAGQVVTPEAPGYDEARTVFATDVDRRPALIVRVSGPDDIARVILHAREYGVAAGAHGLATGFGDAGSVGIGGITLAGGIGFLVRKHGMTIDNLLAAEIVTADGRLRRVDAQTEPDLFWALRGGGGNFGVVTRLKYRLRPVDTIVGGLLAAPARPAVVSGFVAAAEGGPDELSPIANVRAGPPLPF